MLILKLIALGIVILHFGVSLWLMVNANGHKVYALGLLGVVVSALSIYAMVNLWG